MGQEPAPADGRDVAVFESLYLATYADVLRFAQRRVEPADAEDVVAEAFMVVWRRLDELPADAGAARAWLFGITRGVLLNARRGQRRHQALAVRLASPSAPTRGDGVGGQTDLVETLVDVAAAWRHLPAVYQEALALVGLDGLDSRRAATLLGVSPVAFRLRLSRARRALRAHLGQPPPATSVAPSTRAATHARTALAPSHGRSTHDA